MALCCSLQVPLACLKVLNLPSETRHGTSINVDTMVDTRPGDYTLASAPLFHIGALNSFVVRSFFRGNTAIIHRTFDPAQVLADCVQYKVASAFLVPSTAC